MKLKTMRIYLHSLNQICKSKVSVQLKTRLPLSVLMLISQPVFIKFTTHPSDYLQLTKAHIRTYLQATNNL